MGCLGGIMHPPGVVFQAGSSSLLDSCMRFLECRDNFFGGTVRYLICALRKTSFLSLEIGPFECNFILLLGVDCAGAKITYQYYTWKNNLSGYKYLNEAASSLQHMELLRTMFEDKITVSDHMKVHLRYLNQISGIFLFPNIKSAPVFCRLSK